MSIVLLHKRSAQHQLRTLRKLHRQERRLRDSYLRLYEASGSIHDKHMAEKHDNNMRNYREQVDLVIKYIKAL